MEFEILEFIKAADGKKIYSHQIRDMFGIKERAGDNTCYNTRRFITKALDLGIERHVPIGSDGNGYFLIKTRAEMDAFIRNMENRISAITDRKKKVIKAFKNSGEPSIFDIIFGD